MNPDAQAAIPTMAFTSQEAARKLWSVAYPLRCGWKNTSLKRKGERAGLANSVTQAQMLSVFSFEKLCHHVSKASQTMGKCMHVVVL